MLIETQMRTKMLTAALRANKPQQRSIIRAVSASANVGMGMKKVPDWNAHLSHRTYETLKSQGVMA